MIISWNYQIPHGNIVSEVSNLVKYFSLLSCFNIEPVTLKIPNQQK